VKIIFVFLLTLLSPTSWAIDAVHDLSEVELLPSYCKGTLQIRMISNDPKPFAEYVAIYGDPFNYLHHYCWALNSENNLYKIEQDYLKKSELISILGNLQYVLDRSPLSFSLLPDIFISKARILFKMDKDTEALGVLFKLSLIKPGYAPTYAQLGDYYQRIGHNNDAIKMYEQGLHNTNKANAAFFIWKIRKLDKNFKAPLINAAQTALPKQDTSAPATESPSANPYDEAAQNPAKDQTSNPYCRFCP